VKKVFTFLLFCLSLSAVPAQAADKLDGFLALAPDDVAALGQVRGMPDRHVMLYFGDYQN